MEMQNVLFLSGKEISEHSFISAYANKLHHTSVTIISAIQGQVLPSGPAVAPTCSPPSRGLSAGSGLGTASRRDSLSDREETAACQAMSRGPPSHS